MNNYFIIHGTNGSAEGNWFPWLKSEIEKQGKDCIVPQFPIGDKQSYSSWSDVLDNFVSNGKINKDTIFIAHSIAPIFVIKYILEKKIKVSGLISISGFNNYIGPYDEYNKLNKSFFVDDIDEINKYTKFTYCIYSNDDPYIKLDALEKFAANINAEKCLLESAGHINSESGFLRFDKMLEIIKQIDNGFDFAEHDDMPVGVNFIITNEDGDILLGRRINRFGHGTYGLPGGKLKVGETFEECARREIKEEVGINVKDEDMEVINLASTITTKHMLQVGVLIKKYSGVPTNMEPHKCSELKFFSKNNLPELFIGNKPNIDLFLSKKFYSIDSNINFTK